MNDQYLGAVTLAWADGDYTFNVQKIGQALELQEKCGAGVGTIMTRLLNGAFFVNDFRETIRLGLIGGGDVNPPAALSLVKRYVDERPWKESVLVATAIISAAIVGAPEKKTEKAAPADPAKDPPPMETTGPSTDPPSMAPAAQ
jgi:hypothetical protein